MKKMYLIVTVMIAMMVLISACSDRDQDTPAAGRTATAMPATGKTVTAMPTTGETATAMPTTSETPTAMPATGKTATSMTTTSETATAMTAVIPNTGGGAANIMVGKNDELGSFLQDDKGMTLYMFTKDTPNTSTCYDTCATSWLPLLTTGSPVAATGIDASKLDTIRRTDGTMQVTYAGWPLYYFAKDVKAGDTSGQNMNSFWFVVSPEGDQITK